jgi:hypothetical protein
MAKFRMTRIEPPSWATQPGLRIDCVSVSDYASMQRRRDRLLKAVHTAVEDYLNDPRLYFSGDQDGFPHHDRLSGEYYIGRESYGIPRVRIKPNEKPSTAPDLGWFQICVSCHCLEPARTREDRAHDYLGLDVWLRCDPGKWTFSVFRNTDSSSI